MTAAANTPKPQPSSQPAPRPAPSRKRASQGVRYLRGVMIALALALPTLSLAVLGTLWLFQNGGLLIWSIAASTVALSIYLLEVWLVGRRTEDLEAVLTAARDQDPATTRAPREVAALAAVEQLARETRPDTLTSRDAILELGVSTVETVARHMHPGEEQPLWKFTVPEALALVEQVSRKLNHFVVDSVPLGDRLTVAQVLTIYRWRGLVGVAEKAYDLYRLLRFVNPAAAIAGELREKVSGQFIEGMRTEFTRRLARAYVREVGEAAIDLYSGRLRATSATDDRPAGEYAPAGSPPAPLEVLIIGQQGVGKSSLINALSNEVQAAVDVVPTADRFTTYALSREEGPLTYLTDSPGLDTTPARQSEIIARAARADAIVWLLSASRPDRAADAATLRALRADFAARHDRRLPPVVFVVTSIDRVRPFNEWQPPYDLNAAGNLKSRSIRDAVQAVAEDLELDDEGLIPVALASGTQPYNVELVWARLVDVFDDARNVQLLRRLSEGVRTPITKSLWRQAVGAGRVIRTIATK